MSVAPLDEKRAAIPQKFSEDALALDFAALHADDLRFVATWSTWMVWTGDRWHADKTHRAFDLVREVCRDAAAQCNKPNIAKLLSQAKTVAAVTTLARADRRIAQVSELWDANGWVLNTPGGLVDLKTGKMVPHDPGYFATKISSVAPGGDCPRWLAFLDRVMAGDTDLIAFLQRMAGYSLTGSTREHALFFLYGTGANGKTVFISTLSRILGSYHVTAPIETFTASSADRHPTELANLMGARLVTAVETEEGRRWPEARIKTLTGGDTVSARFMRQDFFEYTPQFKLLISGNHKPGLRSVDEAMRRRMNLIPFTVTIPLGERDPDLSDKLKAEWPGILAWAIEGCIDWQKRGLALPKAVTAATTAYLEAEDATAAWIDECCERDPTAWSPSSDLYFSWKAWADRNGEYGASQRRLVQTLEARGFDPLRRKAGRGFLGLRIVPTATDLYGSKW